MRALRAAMGMARELGTGLAFARASNHFGPVAPYAWIAAQEGFASIIGSNASTTIAPWGGRDTRLGNSPVAFCVPDPAGEPVILDMAMSVAARAKIRRAAQAGEPIPAGWATDRDGKPTTDAKAALDGFLLPVGGHKGDGLALMVDLFAGLLSGGAYLTHVKSWQDEPASPSELGHFFFLFDARRLGADEWLAARLRDFRDILHSTPAADPAEPVRLPGERELAEMRRQQREGIDLPRALHEKLVAFAARPRP
jgi:LDH2 family malate/lactate/ureidoglycolate dehydrogenase